MDSDAPFCPYSDAERIALTNLAAVSNRFTALARDNRNQLVYPGLMLSQALVERVLKTIRRQWTLKDLQNMQMDLTLAQRNWGDLAKQASGEEHTCALARQALWNTSRIVSALAPRNR
jgi:hypothetical protein